MAILRGQYNPLKDGHPQWLKHASIIIQRCSLTLMSSTTDLQRVFGDDSDEEVCYPPMHRYGNEFYMMLTMCRTLFHVSGVSGTSALQERTVMRPHQNG